MTVPALRFSLVVPIYNEEENVQNLLAEEPKYADAYDVLGRIHAEQGDLAGAIAAYRQAVEITPFSVARTQKYGILAWYAAEPDEACAALEHAARIGGESPLFDHQERGAGGFERGIVGRWRGGRCRRSISILIMRTWILLRLWCVRFKKMIRRRCTLT